VPAESRGIRPRAFPINQATKIEPNQCSLHVCWCRYHLKLPDIAKLDQAARPGRSHAATKIRAITNAAFQHTLPMATVAKRIAENDRSEQSDNPIVRIYILSVV
jgi:hypothetical protein